MSYICCSKPMQLGGTNMMGVERLRTYYETGVHRMLVRNRVGVGLTRGTVSSFAPIVISHNGCKKPSLW